MEETEMSRPAISNTKLSETLTLSECHDGWWLYDKTRGYNVSMRAKTKDDAFVEALTHYQERLKSTEEYQSSLRDKVETFVKQFVTDEGQCDCGFTMKEVRV
jgi:hypothetical protein